MTTVNRPHVTARLKRDPGTRLEVRGDTRWWDAPARTKTEQLPPETRSELDRVLGPGGLVYVLGGDRAVSPAVVATLQADGYTVRRLAGPSRVETAIAVADEVRAQFPNYRQACSHVPTVQAPRRGRTQ